MVMDEQKKRKEKSDVRSKRLVYSKAAVSLKREDRRNKDEIQRVRKERR